MGHSDESRTVDGSSNNLWDLMQILSSVERIKQFFTSTSWLLVISIPSPVTILDIMLMCHKVTHKNLIDSSPLFRYCLTHASCNFFVKTIDSDTSKEI